ncbi:MAG: hypothetical protein HYR84_15495 [Planctomycetes bacterium]|nr:hypothetical protein [Planctomycetota bacterium]
MGINVWRSLSVLLLVSAALVGCNNTEKERKSPFGANNGPPPGGNPWGNVPQDPRFPANAAGQPFPKAPNNSLLDPRSNPYNFPAGGGANASPINQPGWGSGPSLAPQGANPMFSQPIGGGNSQGAFVPNGSPFQSNPLPAAPQPGNPGFAGSRDPGPMFPGGGTPIQVPQPNGFPGGRQ